ncbi:uncharacterized protein IUM83_04533 [Phytophthora cinnamomi]|uniref:uncharacterized protein n=1 Tax=Phytophthora cinnamomi TaxID=4785 RepID=UPI0035595D56|nr:hypothetical protein IUM83_04533 [Phytophthora cinnamomi]
MELGTSKSAGVLPSTRGKLNRVSRNQQSDEEDNGLSHFYSIEKMAASCFHATQNKNKTWVFLPGSEERSKRSKGSSSTNQNSITGVERPSRRVDVLDLDQCFDTAIQFANKKKHWEIVCEKKLSMLDQDFMAIHARIVQQYGSTVAHDDRKLLTRLVFEQKWADVVMGELESMLTVSFVEQGLILRKARILFAKAFYRLENLFRQQWQELKEGKDELELLREEVRQTNKLHKEDANTMKEHYEEEIEKLKIRFEDEKNEMERRVTDSKEQLAKMGDTMKALNAVFRQMREDTEKVKAVELRESYVRLEHKHEQCREEMEQLRPLVHEKQQLQGKIDELIKDQDGFKSEIANLNDLIKTRDSMIASLMEEQSNLIAAQELKAAREEELRRRAEEDNEDEEEIREPNSAGNDRRRGSVSSTAVCVRCKEELRAMSANGGLVKGDKELATSESGKTNETDGFKLPTKKRRIQCLYFRVMLPNLGGHR